VYLSIFPFWQENKGDRIEVPLKQLVISSGKGGTGKTSLAAAFVHLACTGQRPIKVLLADADVDAANLELVLRPEHMESHEFIGGSVAKIDPDLCQDCGVCEQVCRFDAILVGRGCYTVDPIACDGCAACVYQCPEGALTMQSQIVGQWYRSESLYGPLFHADLCPAQENSGKLVTLVKQNARLLALDASYQLIIVDGPPGIGCPVISAIAGAAMLLVVTEPTSAGIHDMERVIQLAQHFRLPTVVCINKVDIYLAGSDQIKKYCAQNRIEVIGKIPYDEAVTLAMIQGEPVTSYQSMAPASRAIKHIWTKILTEMLVED
jgi:MinD superfamily P-loop ATPase